MSSSNPTSPKPDQKLKAIVEAVEEKRTVPSNPKQEYSPKEAVPEKTITELVAEWKSTERPYFGLEDYVRAEKIMMEKFPLPRENLVLTCDICNREFLASTLFDDDNVSGSSYPLASTTGDVPLAHPLPPPPTTNLSTDENVSDAKGKNKI